MYVYISIYMYIHTHRINKRCINIWPVRLHVVNKSASTGWQYSSKATCLIRRGPLTGGPSPRTLTTYTFTAYTHSIHSQHWLSSLVGDCTARINIAGCSKRMSPEQFL